MPQSKRKWTLIVSKKQSIKQFGTGLYATIVHFKN